MATKKANELNQSIHFTLPTQKKGILVSGGVDESDVLLASAEFYSLRTESWTELSGLKTARTEHGEYS